MGASFPLPLLTDRFHVNLITMRVPLVIEHIPFFGVLAESTDAHGKTLSRFQRFRPALNQTVVNLMELCH